MIRPECRLRTLPVLDREMILTCLKAGTLAPGHYWAILKNGLIHRHLIFDGGNLPLEPCSCPSDRPVRAVGHVLACPHFQKVAPHWRTEMDDRIPQGNVEEDILFAMGPMPLQADYEKMVVT